MGSEWCETSSGLRASGWIWPCSQFIELCLEAVGSLIEVFTESGAGSLMELWTEGCGVTYGEVSFTSGGVGR